MKPVTITVTQAHVDAARGRDKSACLTANCPLALAIGEQTIGQVRVGLSTVVIYHPDLKEIDLNKEGAPGYHVDLPRPAHEFRKAFDFDRSMRLPLTFVIMIPEDLCKSK